MPRASRSGGAGQMAATAAIEGSAAAAWMARKPPMLDPRSPIRGACSPSTSHMASTSPTAAGPNAP